MKTNCVDGYILKSSNHTLHYIGYINSYSGIKKNPQWMDRMTNKFTINDLISEIKHLNKIE